MVWLWTQKFEGKYLLNRHFGINLDTLLKAKIEIFFDKVVVLGLDYAIQQENVAMHA